MFGTSVTYENITPEIALIRLNEQDTGNTFTPSIIDGLLHCQNVIAKDPEVKVLVVTGSDNYFSCGGTKKELEDIRQGRLSFTDLTFYRFLLDINIPTISAMQGHALGGGLVMGLYADFLVFSSESAYSANFMNFGFTPGMGATYIVPHKLGPLLGMEMLYSGNNYYGRELKERGIGATVVERGKVLETALNIAHDLADKPKSSLTLLKATLTKDVKKALPDVVKNELGMHEVSFSQDVVKQRIQAMIGEV